MTKQLVGIKSKSNQQIIMRNHKENKEFFMGFKSFFYQKLKWRYKVVCQVYKYKHFLTERKLWFAQYGCYVAKSYRV